MTRPKFTTRQPQKLCRTLLFLATAAVTFTGLASRGLAEANRPNIVLCMADDQGWGDVGYYGKSIAQTPVLDEMAATGLRFDRFYAACPVCSPTRGSVMTGGTPIDLDASNGDIRCGLRKSRSPKLLSRLAM